MGVNWRQQPGKRHETPRLSAKFSSYDPFKTARLNQAGRKNKLRHSCGVTATLATKNHKALCLLRDQEVACSQTPSKSCKLWWPGPGGPVPLARSRGPGGRSRWPGPVALSRWRSRWPGPGGPVLVARPRWPGPGGPVPVARSRWPGRDPQNLPGPPRTPQDPPGRSWTPQRTPQDPPPPVARPRWPGPGGPVPVARSRSRFKGACSRARAKKDLFCTSAAVPLYSGPKRPSSRTGQGATWFWWKSRALLKTRTTRRMRQEDLEIKKRKYVERPEIHTIFCEP